MICSNCGKDIPFNGTVCPHCHMNKQGDQIGWALANTLGCALAVIGVVVGSAVAGVGGGFVGFFIGAIVGVGIGVSQGNKATAHIRAAAEQRRQESETKRIEEEEIASRSSYPEREQAMLDSGAYKKCPHCAEVIRSEAKVCRYCNRNVSDNQAG